ncbi:S8 family serine peptidase [Lentibacillus sp. Marseille-P4043]|uniref:S8 family serine peptidase n=1 Tax=Lentibacillus sp. Marseille-P4043 TaxID=2040293 RepID=UPI002D789AB9|nr:S8 family serine peptidase [Lentibacillus sp. Marseille-P4043]
MRFMRRFTLITIMAAAFILAVNHVPTTSAETENKDDTISVIIEVEGDPVKHKKYIEVYYPYVDVVATYDKLFKGLALQGDTKNLSKMESLDFVKAVHPVKTYQAISRTLPVDSEESNAVIPAAINNTPYTGEGVKVGVIDTGIDYDHPDLVKNYQAGYDLVDLDDDPMETVASEGMPTLHGTHVAGIIAANGGLRGVAPDADIYAYRALGPGGQGSSVQVIAALEQAVEDGVDIINLSLGNAVNGPDYPTSIAVNRAVELGVAVVIANGNSGPDNWTVGSPATASKALSVGALAMSQRIPFLYDPIKDKQIAVVPMVGSATWNLERDFKVINKTTDLNDARGKIVLLERGKIPFYEKAKKAEEAGAVAVLIYNNEQGIFQGSVENEKDALQIPVAAITKKEGEWLKQRLKQNSVYLETTYKQTTKGIADFSSRGPVTVNWDIKPDVIAPGANILSTVPGGYRELQGTSMAAPHVAGALALLKEAHPDWTVEQLKDALKTTALPLKNQEPIVQGMGQIQPGQAIKTNTIIHDPLLSFGKINDYKERKTIQVSIENTTDQEQRYSFDIPKVTKGITWHLPQTFTVEANSEKTVPVELSVVTPQLDEGIYQGRLTLNQESEVYQLPYLFVNETADYPKAMGFDFGLEPFSDDRYVYQLYLTDSTQKVEVNLYNSATLLYERQLLTIDDPQVGMNEGKIAKSELGEPGTYKALITVQLENGAYESYETEIQINP